jgi:hypothetical protein
LCEDRGMVLAILNNKERYDTALEYLNMYVFIMMEISFIKRYRSKIHM